MSAYDTPEEYPLGDLVKKLPDEVRLWVSAQNMDTKTCDELRDLLRKGRHTFGLPPWHLFTAVMQAYAAAAWAFHGGQPRWEHAWFTNNKVKRSLDIYQHDYDDVHEIWVAKRGGDNIFVGWLILRFDGRQVFSFWSERTERYCMDCTKGLKIQDPFTKELLLTHHGLSKWLDHVSIDGRSFVPQAKILRSKIVKNHKKQMEEEETARRAANRPTIMVLEKRLKLLQLFQSILNPESMAAYVSQNHDLKDMYVELCGVLRSSLDIYVTRLRNKEVTNIRIPDDVMLTCQSLLQLYAQQTCIHNTISLWFEDLIKTDTKH